jgi:hypothetical protein
MVYGYPICTDGVTVVRTEMDGFAAELDGTKEPLILTNY